MELENVECIPQRKSNSFVAEALSKLSTVLNPHCEVRSSVSQIDAIEPDFSNQGARLYDPGIVVVEQSPHPPFCRLFRHRAQVGAVTSIHPKYLSVGSEPEAGFEILFAGSAERDPLTY